MKRPNSGSLILSRAIRPLVGVAFLTCALILPQPSLGQVLKEDQVISVPDSDRAMGQAIQRARATLPHFFKLLTGAHGKKHGFGLKSAIRDGDAVEHMWLLDPKQVNGEWTGVIDNVPRTVSSVKMGLRYAIPHGSISDWMYMENGKLYGGYTIRVLAERVSPEEKALLKTLLAYEPK